MERIASPSSRRAWIEIVISKKSTCMVSASPSSRRAWIEMFFVFRDNPPAGVALLAEGVDRNLLELGGT